MIRSRLYGTVKAASKIVIGASIFAASVAAILYTFQDRLIYINRNYQGDAYYQAVMRNVEKIKYGKNTAFYVPPKQEMNDNKINLWILFGGNAALALDWYDFCIALQKSRPDWVRRPFFFF